MCCKKKIFRKFVRNKAHIMEYNSVLFAKYIIAMANERGVPINMTKTQKLLYVAYGTCLAVKGTRLLDEHPQAWPYGPVFPTTRNKLLKQNFYDIRISNPEFDSIREDKEANSLINLVFRGFGDWTAGQLSEWSHSDGSPWERTVDSEDFSWGNRMSDEDIKSYFSMILQ